MSKITKKQLVGNWTLVSSTTEFEGKKAHALIDSGRITYTQDGTMFANLTMGKRQRLDVPMISIKNLNSWKATPVKNVKAILNYLHGSTKYMSYTGHYEIKKNEIHHSVKMSSVVDLEGSVLVRQAKFNEDREFNSQVQHSP